MNLKRVMFISGVFLISLLFLLFFLENKITGKITYDPSEFNVCNNVQQLDLWSNTFEVSGGDATTFDEVVVAPDICDEYLMYLYPMRSVWYECVMNVCWNCNEFVMIM